MAHLSQRKFRSNRRGFSTVVAAIFMVLAVMFLFFNVFMFIQSENTRLENTISQSAQLDADRTAELGLTIVIASFAQNAINPWEFDIACSFVNNSPLAIQLVRLWVQDYQTSPKTNSVVLTTTAFQPGAKTGPVLFHITLTGALPGTGSLRVWFITSRGNSILRTIN